MNITRDTKLKEILTSYPQAKEMLPSINPKFKMLNTPMGKVMMGKATIAEMSKKSGMDESELIKSLTDMISSLK